LSRKYYFILLKDSIMIGYVMVGANDLEYSTAFYDAILDPLGLARVETLDTYAAYAPLDKPAEIEFYVTLPINQQAASFGNGSMIALVAESRLAVDGFHSIALGRGAIDEGSPGPRPADGEIYYAYVRDPDVNKICAHTNQSG
jgi:catechol 2,3-dioxygenase-like lactoylglutathione lyase family enzyme